MAPSEVPLIVYFEVVWRWKWFIVMGTVAAVLTVYLLTARHQEPFTASTTIDVGNPGEQESKYLQRFLTDFRRQNRGVGNLTVQSLEPGIIQIELTTESRSAAQSELDVIAGAAEADLTKIVDRERQRLASLEEQRTQLQTYIAELQKIQLETARREVLNALPLFSALSTEISSTRSAMTVLNTELDFHSDLSLHRGPTQVRRATGLSRRILLSETALGAVIAFTCFAFFADYLRGARFRQRASYESRTPIS